MKFVFVPFFTFSLLFSFHLIPLVSAQSNLPSQEQQLSSLSSILSSLYNQLQSLITGAVPESKAQTGGNTYYVATNGDDSRSCTQARSINTPRRTIAEGMKCLVGGDTLIIRAGTYPERISNTIPSGASWSSPTTIRGEPRGQAILLPGPTESNLRSVIALVDGVHHIVIDGLVLDAGNTCCNSRGYPGNVLTVGGFNDGVPVAHVRIQNSILRNAPNNCMGTGDGSSDISLLHSEVSGCKPRGNATARSKALGTHGVYWSAGDAVIEGNYFHDIDGNGMQILNLPHGPASNIVVRNNRVEMTRDYGIYIGAGASNSLVANNIVASVKTTGITTGGQNTRVLNNTVYDTPIGIRVVGNGHRVTNNIIFNSAQHDIFYSWGSEAGNNVSNNLTTDPRFVNAASGNFHLQSSSPAINQGITLSEVTTDYDGTSRPQGCCYDIGAYEFVSGVPPPPPPPPSPQPPPPPSQITPTSP